MIKHRVRTFDIVNVVILTIFALICFYPFYYLVLYSMSNSTAVAVSPIWLLPRGFTLACYEKLIILKPVLYAVVSSASRAILGTMITIFCSSMFAYLLTKKELVCHRLFYRLLVITMYLNAGLIPYFIIMKTYGLNDNYLLYIIPTAIGPFYVILVKTYIEGIPIALEEAAKIDGAGYFKIFIQIIMPVCLPVVATVAIFSAVTQWNTWQDNFYLVHRSNLQTLQMVLLQYLQNMSSTLINDINAAKSQASQVSSLSIKATISVITMVPIMVVYPFMQRYFVKGILIGSVKG